MNNSNDNDNNNNNKIIINNNKQNKKSRGIQINYHQMSTRHQIHLFLLPQVQTQFLLKIILTTILPMPLISNQVPSPSPLPSLVPR